MRNKGIELSLGYNDRFGKVGYATNLTYTANRNKIMKMVHDYKNPSDGSLFSITELTLQDKGGVYLREKDAIGDVYVKGILARGKDGKLIEEEGGYKVDRSQRIKIGSVNPDFSAKSMKELVVEQHYSGPAVQRTFRRYCHLFHPSIP